jgi:hypothetical protein
MAKTKLSDLNEHLFMVIERLNEEDMTDEKLKLEIARADAISKAAGRVIEAGHLVLKAHVAVDNSISGQMKVVPPMLE